ncbi:MAG: Ig-like domain-containing protein [Eubacterium sp.]|nr:Ig-like domain-containing protein [Eubacterium sp.]
MKHFLKKCLMICFLALFFATPAKAAAPSVEDAVVNALKIAADNRHGYSMSSRWGNPDYDCSSCVYTVFEKAGFPLTGTGDRCTQTMAADFVRAGFTWIPWSRIGSAAGLERGDILLNNGASNRHAEIYLGDSMLVGAHHDYGYPAKGDQNGKEISTGWYYSHPWLGVLRWQGKASGQIASANPSEETSAEPAGSVTSIKITGSKKTLRAGRTMQLKAKVKADAGVTKKVKWTTSNRCWAGVSTTGKVRAKFAGKGKVVKITATSTDGSKVKKAVKVRIK